MSGCIGRSKPQTFFQQVFYILAAWRANGVLASHHVQGRSSTSKKGNASGCLFLPTEPTMRTEPL